MFLRIVLAFIGLNSLVQIIVTQVSYWYYCVYEWCGAQGTTTDGLEFATLKLLIVVSVFALIQAIQAIQAKNAASSKPKE